MIHDKENNVALVDVVDRLLEKGAVVKGDVAIRLADIDLVYINLRLMVTSISKITSLQDENLRQHPEEPFTKSDVQYLNRLNEEIRKAESAIPKVIEGNAEEMEKSLARLVLTLVELLRRIMEREALRQVKMGRLNNREKEKLGLTLKALYKKMESIRTIFGLKEEDLNLDLGPLGELM